MQARLAIDARDRIGKAPAWDAGGQRLLWSDNESGIVHEARSNGRGGWFECRQWSLGRPIAAALPRAGGGLVVVGGTEIFLLDDFGHITPFAQLDADPKVAIANDAKCDTQGRLWVGTRSTDLSPGGGALYRVDPNGSVITMLENASVSDGFAWSPDGSTFYYIDSPTLSVDAFHFDVERGSISHRCRVIKIKYGDGIPDGMTTDHEGCLWVAIVGAGEVRRYTPDGLLLARVETSTHAVTSCAFGGPDGGDLFLTSLGRRLSPVFLDLGLSAETVERSANAPGAGGVFVCRPGQVGAPATPFAG